MGLFDRLKKKKEVSKKDIKSKKEPTIVVKEDDNKNIIFRKNTGSNDVKATREEAEEAVNKIKKEYGEKLKSKVNIMGQDIDIDLSKEFNQSLDEAIIENYGTDREIADLKLKRLEKEKIKEKTSKIRDLYDYGMKHSIDGNYDLSNGAFEEIIATHEVYDSTVSLAYYNLIDNYAHLKQYDKAFEVAEKQKKELIKLGKSYNKVDHHIKKIKQLKKDRELRELEKKSESLFYATKFDDAMPYFKKAIDSGSTRYQTFKCISQIYIREKDLDSAINVLKIGIERIEKENEKTTQYSLSNEHNDGLKDILENINHKIETGKFKWDCLPMEKQDIVSQISDAKAILKDDKDKGVELLEEIMANETFSNTVYYTLYQTYKKDKRFDDAIRVSDKAIDVLGYFDSDRLNKWTNYKEKLIIQKEKAK